MCFVYVDNEKVCYISKFLNDFREVVLEMDEEWRLVVIVEVKN